MMKLIKVLKNEDFGEENVNEANLILRNAVRAVVINDKNEILIIEVKNGNYHKIPGGGIEENEDKIIALRREVMEEAGVEIELIKEIGYIIEYRDDNLQYSYAYLVRAISDPKSSNLTKDEIEAGFQKPEFVEINKAIEIFKKDEPTFLRAKFMGLRDRLFVEEARDLL